MNLTVNGHSQVPPGFRFHPTEEELLLYYLHKKVANLKIDLDVIQDVDLNKLEPWDIQEKCRIGSSAQNDWYFFSHKDKKYPTGTRTNRATAAGFWKATGRDKVICSSSKRIGMRKTLVFYTGRAPHGQKSDWIMHEYRLDDHTSPTLHNASSSGGEQSTAIEEGWVVCRVFKKKNYVKALDSPTCRTSLQPSSTSQGLDQILSYIGKAKAEAGGLNLTDLDQVVQDRFLHLPQLESPTDQLPFDQDGSNSINSGYQTGEMFDYATVYKQDSQRASTTSWVELDQLVAYQLNGESARRLSCFNTISQSAIPFTATPFCLTDDNEGSDEYTKSPSTSFQQLLRSQSSPVYDTEAVDDQLYWSFARPSA